MSSTEQRDIDMVTAKLTEMTRQMLVSIPEEESFEQAVPVFDAFIEELGRFLSDPPFTRDALIAIIAAMASDRVTAERDQAVAAMLVADAADELRRLRGEDGD